MHKVQESNSMDDGGERAYAEPQRFRYVIQYYKERRK